MTNDGTLTFNNESSTDKYDTLSKCHLNTGEHLFL